MNPVKVVHLLDDMSPGGVTQALAFYELPEIKAVAESRIEVVDPNRGQPPRLDADVIITHFPPRWRALPFLYALRLRNRKARLIHVEHSYTAAWETLHVPKVARFRTMLKAGLRVYDRVVAVSAGQGRWLQDIGAVKASRLTVIPPWSHVEGLNALEAPCPTNQRPLIVGAYGRFAEQKGFDRLIDCFRQFDDGRYVLRIGGFGPQEAALKQRAADCAQIEFVGPVTDRAAFLSQCDVVAVPSRWEAFGLVATEARAAGRPVLVADVDGLPEQVGEAGLVVDFDDAHGLSLALTQLGGDRLRLMSRHARRSVQGGLEQRLNAWQALLARA